MKLKELMSPVTGCKAYRSDNNLVVICGREPCGPRGEMRWHLSISHNKRNPTWEEIRDIRYELIPDEVMMAMFLPPRGEYVNLNKFCFHLFEIEESETPRVSLVTT